jgi:hypothetical protein
MPVCRRSSGGKRREDMMLRNRSEVDIHASKSINHATIMGASFSGLTRWLDHDCACSRLFLAWRNITTAATHTRAAKPTPAPIPAFAPVLRPLSGEGPTSSRDAVVIVDVVAEGEAEVVLLGGVEGYYMKKELDVICWSPSLQSP